MWSYGFPPSPKKANGTNSIRNHGVSILELLLGTEYAFCFQRKGATSKTSYETSGNVKTIYSDSAFGHVSRICSRFGSEMRQLEMSKNLGHSDLDKFNAEPIFPAPEFPGGF